MVKYDIKKAEPLKLEIKTFVKSVENDMLPEVSGETALKSFQIAQQTLKSSKLGRVIKVKW